MQKPGSVNIFGVAYAITYVDKPSDVDIFKRESCWGQIDYWTRTIRVYAHDRTPEDILHTIIHEALHGIAQGLHLKSLSKDENHEELDMLSLALADVFVRNGWVELWPMEGKK